MLRYVLAVVVLVVSLASLGCGPPPAVRGKGLGLKRVVVYRNGVGYFLRGGHVSSDHVHFKVRANEIGDFLASLAVIERGGSSVKSASFPLRVDRQSTAVPPVKGKGKPTDLETVVMELDGKSHDLEVGYIAATPVWRPSYRLVIHDDGVDLQLWGIVQNLSGEDWSKVSLSLVTGAPLSFEAALATPVIPQRPRITDEGDMIAAVPQSETSLEQTSAGDSPSPPLPPPPPPLPSEAEVAPAVVAEKEDADERRAKAARRPVGGLRPEMPMPRAQGPSPPRSLSALASVAIEGSATRYDIPLPVTVPNRSATMVLLSARRVPGEAVFLFAPDPGVADSLRHPFRIARFTNRTGGLLERGPLAIFEQGSFLGQGLVEPLPEGATASVPFALERGIAVARDVTYDELGARLFRIEAGQLSIERDGVTRTKYVLRNGNRQPAKLLLKQPRNTGARLHNPPGGTEDNLAAGSALVPVKLAGRASSELLVEERLPSQRTVDWLSQLADDAVRGYLDDRRADATLAAALRGAWQVRKTLVDALELRRKLADEQAELRHATQETRDNLRALEKNRAAGDLRAKLAERLDKHSQRLDEITKRLVEVDMQVNEQRVRFVEIIRNLKLERPLPPG